MPTESQEESISSMERTKHDLDGASPLISGVRRTTRWKGGNARRSFGVQALWRSRVRLALPMAVSALLHVAVPAVLIARALDGDLPEPSHRIICIFPSG